MFTCHFLNVGEDVTTITGYVNFALTSVSSFVAPRPTVQTVLYCRCYKTTNTSQCKIYIPGNTVTKSATIVGCYFNTCTMLYAQNVLVMYMTDGSRLTVLSIKLGIKLLLTYNQCRIKKKTWCRWPHLPWSYNNIIAPCIYIIHSLLCTCIDVNNYKLLSLN